MIPAATLAAMQAAANKTLDKTATIQRASNASDGYGQNTETWGTAPGGSNAACRLATPSQAIMQQYAAYIGNQQAWVVSFGATQDVQEKDRLVFASMTLTVHAPLNPESYSVLNRVLAIKIG